MGRSTSTLHTSALALCYSVTEYGTAVQCGLDPATQISSTPSFIALCTWFQAACILCRSQWLPVLTNVAPPSLHHNVATDNMLHIIKAHPNWPVHADVFEHPPPRLASLCQIWSDMAPVDTTTLYREDWSSASVIKHSIVTDPTIWLPGFDLPRHTWSVLNHFFTGQGPCCANLHKCGLAQSSSCDCGQRQTMNHIVDMCQLHSLKADWNYSTKQMMTQSCGWNQ